MTCEYRRNSSGISLIEVITVIAIASILVTFAVPNFSATRTQDRMASEINNLSGDIEFARMGAVENGISVTVCASENPSAASPSCSGNNNWSLGWIVFTDFNNNQIFNSAAGDAVLRVDSGLTSGDTLTGETGTSGAFSGDMTGITINRMGTTSNGNGVLTLHDSGNTLIWRRCLVIPVTGIVYIDTQEQNPGVCP